MQVGHIEDADRGTCKIVWAGCAWWRCNRGEKYFRISVLLPPRLTDSLQPLSLPVSKRSQIFDLKNKSQFQLSTKRPEIHFVSRLYEMNGGLDERTNVLLTGS